MTGAAGRMATLGLGASVLSMACTLVLQRDTGQCQSHADCEVLGQGYLCASDQVCSRFEVSQTDAVAVDAGTCVRDDDCVALGLAVCRRGACLPLNAPEHGCVSLNLGTTAPVDGSVPLLIGMLAKRDDLYITIDRRLTGPAGTALNDLNRARDTAGITALPALVGVACDEASPSALEYLVGELQVQLLLGPTSSSRVQPLLSQIGQRSVLWAPFADSPDLQEVSGASMSWLVSCKANRAGTRTYFLPAVAEVEALASAGLGAAISSVVAVSGDEATTEFFDGFNTTALEAAGLRGVPYTAASRGRGLVSALEGAEPYPNLVVAASAEDNWGENIAALDRSSYDLNGTYPYYFLSEKRSDVYLQTLGDQATAKGFLPQYRRLIGLDYHRDAPSNLARAEFEVAHRDETGAEPEPGFEYAYDCLYLAVYAAVAASRRFSIPIWSLPPAALASGVSALMGAGPLLPVGAATIAEVVANLVSNRGGPGSVNLIGTSGDLEFVGEVTPGSAAARYLAPHTPDGELYCVDATSKVFCDTGISFSAADGATSRSGAGKCTCFGGDP